jgi:hypothetical protein
VKQLAVLLPVSILVLSACSSGLVKPGAEVRSALPPKTHTLAEAWSGAESALSAIGQPVPLDVYTQVHQISGNGIIVIEVRSHDFDALAAVVNGAGELVAFNDNWGGTRNARVVIDGAPAGGRLLVFSRDDSRGLYDVVVTQGTPDDLEEFVAASDLQSGQVRGWLDQSARNPMVENLLRTALENQVSIYNFSRALLYPFTMAEGGIVSLALESDAFDPYLVLLSVDKGAFSFVDYNDDYSGSWSRIVRNLPAGEYMAVVMPYSESGFGEFVLRLETLGEEAFETTGIEAPREGVDYPGTIAPNRNLAIAWWPGMTEDWNAPFSLSPFSPVAAYTFSVSSPAIRRLDATSDADICLTLLRRDDDQVHFVSFNDDHPEMGTSSRIRGILAPGEYIALVSLYSGTEETDVTFNWITSTDPIQTLRAGRTVQADAPYAIESLYFELDVTAGREYSILVESTDLDPVITLFLPDGESLQDDDGGGGTNSLINFTPAEGQSGTCFLQVDKYSPGDGSFTIIFR